MKTELTKQAIQELLHNEIDGLNSPEESARLRDYMTLNSELEEELRGLQELAEMLKRVEQLTPRPHLSARIMKTIRETSSVRSAPAGFFGRLKSMSVIRALTTADRNQVHHRNSYVSNSPQYTNPGGYMKNKLMIGGVTFTVLAVIYVAFLYPWPAGQGTEGTIGGVKKYNAHQLAEKDVQLQDITSGSVDKDMILSFYTSAPLSDREAFERSYSIEKSSNSSIDKSSNYSIDKSSNSSIDKSSNSSIDKSSNSSIDKSSNSSIDKSSNSSIDKSSNSSIDRTAGVEKSSNSSIDRTAGVEKSSNSSIDRAAGVEKSSNSSIDRTAGVEKSSNSSIDRAAGVEKSSNSSIDKSSNSSIDRTAGMEKSANSSIDRSAGVEKSSNSSIERSAGMQKTSDSDLSRAVAFWNQANVEMKATFAKSWMERSQGLERSATKE